MKRRIVASLTPLLPAVIFLASAVATKPPADPKFLAITNISVLPIVDARAGDKAKVDLGKLQENLVSILKHKRYHASAADTSAETPQIAPEDLESPTPDFIRKLGPPNDRWVMVVALDDAISKIGFGSTGNAHVSGYLFDKEKSELMWKGNGVGQAGQGGLLGMALKGAMQGAALGDAVTKLLNGVPDRPKGEK